MAGAADSKTRGSPRVFLFLRRGAAFAWVSDHAFFCSRASAPSVDEEPSRLRRPSLFEAPLRAPTVPQGLPRLRGLLRPGGGGLLVERRCRHRTGPASPEEEEATGGRGRVVHSDRHSGRPRPRGGRPFSFLLAGPLARPVRVRLSRTEPRLLLRSETRGDPGCPLSLPWLRAPGSGRRCWPSRRR